MTTYTDGLGRLIKVDEPSAGANSPGTGGSGSIVVSGSLHSSTTPGTQATGNFTISGTEQSVRPWICNDLCVRGPLTYDTGYVSVTVNGCTQTATYGQGSTAAAIASALASSLSACSSVSVYYPGGATVYLTAVQPGPNYSFSAASDTYDPTDFGGASFGATLSGATLTGGVYPVTTYDSGTVTVTVNGFQAAVAYNQNLNSTASALASTLTSALNASGSPVTASLSGTTISMAAKTVGSSTNYAVTGSSTASFTASSTTLANGSDPSGIYAPLTTTYAYDALNDLRTVTQGSQTRTYLYDGLGRLTSAATPESGTVTYAYLDSGGALCSGDPSAACSSTDARGVITTHTYDALNRPVQVSYNVGNTGVPVTPPVIYAYGTSIPDNNNSRLISMTDGAGTESYTYDILGRITNVAKVIGTTSYNMAYSYNPDGTVQNITYPSGRVVNYTYDTLSRLSQVNTGGSNLISVPSNGYAASGQLTNINYTNSVQGTFSFNDHLQTNTIKYVNGASTLLDLTYNYGTANNGQIQSITDNQTGARTTQYAYDSLSRLNAAQTTDLTSQNTWALSWTYDRYGNRLTQSLTGGVGSSITQPQLTVNAATNRITTSGYQYDASGNLTNDSMHTYAYDAENRVVSVDGGTTTFTYDGNGLRVKKNSNSYMYWGKNVMAEYSSGALSTEYVYTGSLLATIPAGGTPIFNHRDHLSIRVQTDSSGNPIHTADNFPFGETWYETGAVNKWKFTSYERDSETGLDDATFRYYGNRLGRFMTPDPYSGSMDLANPQSMNRYAYVGNDPINYWDPFGLDCVGGITGAGTDLFERDNSAPTFTTNGSAPCPAGSSFRGGEVDQPPPLIFRPGPGDGPGGGGGGGGGGDTNKIKSEICNAIPSGRTTGASGGIGGVGSVGGGGELVLNYNSGQASAFGFGGVQVGWNGGISGSVYTGFVYGLSDSNSNYKGGFTGLNGGAGPGGFAASSSGGLTGGGKGLAPDYNVKVGGVSFGGSLTGATFGATATNYSNPHQLDQFSGFTPVDFLLYAARQVCK